MKKVKSEKKNSIRNLPTIRRAVVSIARETNEGGKQLFLPYVPVSILGVCAFSLTGQRDGCVTAG